MGKGRAIVAVVSLILIGILWLIVLGASVNPGTQEYGRKGVGMLAIALGVHLISFRNEHSAFWRRENRAFWRHSFIGDMIDQQYSPVMIAVFGAFFFILGVIFLLIRG